MPELREEITGRDDLSARSLLNSSSESGLVGEIELESLGAFHHEYHNHCPFRKLPSWKLDSAVANDARGYDHSVMIYEVPRAPNETKLSGERSESAGGAPG